jgi:ribose 5-phosphate isomerase B
MRVAIAADHAGYSLKQHLLNYLQKQGYELIDLGTNTPDVPADYPDTAQAIADALLSGQAERGILACGSGIGVSIAANKIPGIYAAVCHDTYSAHQGVEHDRMNVLCVGARVIGPLLAQEIADSFLKAQRSDEERHARRFGKLLAIEQREQK